MGHRRHWKQRWDPNAAFVFTRRLKLGLDPKNPWVYPGDDVPSGDVRLGRGRLRKWWDAGIISIKGWKPGSQALAPAIDAAKAESPAAPAPELTTVETTSPGPGPEIVQTEDGFEVMMPDGTAATVSTMEEVETFVRTGEAPEIETAEPGAGPVVETPEDGILVEPTGGGWFAVTVPGEDEPRKVRGEAKLEELLAELRAE